MRPRFVPALLDHLADNFVLYPVVEKYHETKALVVSIFCKDGTRDGIILSECHIQDV